MALEYAHGAIQWLAADAPAVTYPVTGLSFQPKALKFTWVGLQSATDALSGTVDLNAGVGFAVSTSSRRCINVFSDDAAATSACASMARDDAIACTTDAAAADDGRLDLSAIASDGFTAIVDNSPTANITVFWEAWGGADITNATIVDISEPSGTGDQDYTATGFIPGAIDQVVMFAGCQDSNALNTGLVEAAGMCVGFATGRSQCVAGVNSDHASTSADTDRWGLQGECIGSIIRAGVGAGGAVQARASLTQFNAGGFRLNWAAVGITGRKYIALAIKGGGWLAGGLQINTADVNNTSKVSGLGFLLKGVSFVTITSDESPTNFTHLHSILTFGCASSTSSRRSMSFRDQNSADPMEVYTGLDYDSVWISLTSTGTINAEVDISAFDQDGFTLIVDATASAVINTWTGWLAFGNNADRGGAKNARAKDQPMIRGPM